MAVIAKYVHVDRDAINVQLEKHGEYDVLELNITLPDTMRNKQ
jgi:cell division topological specificity factor